MCIQLYSALCQIDTHRINTTWRILVSYREECVCDHQVRSYGLFTISPFGYGQSSHPTRLVGCYAVPADTSYILTYYTVCILQGGVVIPRHTHTRVHARPCL